MNRDDVLSGIETPTETDEEAIERLAALSPLDYDRKRITEAKKMDVRPATLDGMVLAARKVVGDDTENNELIEGVEPWPDPVCGSDLLDNVRAVLNRYCVLPEGGNTAIAIWALGTYCINAFRIFPKLCLSSPEKRCGKTTTLEALGAVVNRSLVASNLTSSVLFRAIESWQPSLLIDEADTFIYASDDLRGVINSGHTRSGAFVLRTEGDSTNREPKQFSTWAPMAIAMIKTPPDTIRDRSIMVLLRRKKPGESAERLPFDLAEECIALRQQCQRWADDNQHRLRSHAPDVPAVANDRAMDNWRSLISIADLAGGDWPDRVRAAMLILEQIDDDDDGIGPMILHDVRQAFKEAGQDKMFSGDLVDALVNMEERPWGEWRQGKPLTQTSLAKLLKPYKISSSQIRIGPGGTKKGYRLDSFDDAFERYLSTPAIQSETMKQASKYGASSDFQDETNTPCVSGSKSLNPSKHGGCFDVSFQNGGVRPSTTTEEVF